MTAFFLQKFLRSAPAKFICKRSRKLCPNVVPLFRRAISNGHVETTSRDQFLHEPSPHHLTGAFHVIMAFEARNGPDARQVELLVAVNRKIARLRRAAGQERPAIFVNAIALHPGKSARASIR